MAGLPKNLFFKYHNDPAREPVLVDYCRTPIGKRNGKVGRLRGDDLVIHCINALIDRNAWLAEDVKRVGDVIVGCNSQIGSCALDIARTAVLGSKLDWSTPGVSLNRLCASGMQATNFAWQEIAAGEKDMVIAGGIELQNTYPIGADNVVNGVETPRNPKMFENDSVKTSRAKYGESIFPDDPNVAKLSTLAGQIVAAELMAHVWGVSREELDTIAYESHMKANQDSAWVGRGKEIIPLEVPRVDENGQPVVDENNAMIPGETEVTDRDEGVRPDTSVMKLAKLPPIVIKDKGLLTAGNSCPTSDGAATAIWMARGLAEELGISIRASLLGCIAVGTDPVLGLTGPIDATKAVMTRCDTSLDDMDVIEMNEAFSSVVYACCHDLGIDLHDERFNPWGGALALGHPTGMSGVRLIGTLVHQLETSQKSYGYATFCVGRGMGIGGIVKREGA
ncbi:MAG TPA: thiolase family protein [Candidatus Lokiarchaeia archaeon]|nr:thiolase family protein [Candidatus Lokiarchaeia archaeon]